MNDLIEAARAAAHHAYAPYSNFRVGAALRLTDGSIVTGANVENASYGLSLCAEAVAIAKAANEGRLADIGEIAVVGLSAATPLRPCGRCRQMLVEAARLGNKDIKVHCFDATGKHEIYELSQLMPFTFEAGDLFTRPSSIHEL